MRPVQVGIFHPSDPVYPIPGGIDTVIRGVLKYAPPDIDYTLYGATGDVVNRPVGREVIVQLGERAARFVPLVGADPSAKRSRIPLSVRYMLELQRYRRAGLLQPLQILDFHRIEPVALFKDDPRPKNLMLHQDMSVIRQRNCDIGWRHAPWLYERIERSLFGTIEQVFCVRQSAVDRYRVTYPGLRDRFRFIPTWLDTDLFYPAQDGSARERLLADCGIAPDAHLLISIGRLDRQKNPQLLIEAFSALCRTRPDTWLLVVGDGVLRAQVEDRARKLQVFDKIRFLGVMHPSKVAELLRAADVLVLTSAYEGMPIVALEAMASGVPVVSTDVGEIRRIVQPGVNGAISPEHTAQSMSAALEETLQRLQALRGAPCEQAATPFYPRRVLSQIYDNHRRQSGAMVA